MPKPPRRGQTPCTASKHAPHMLADKDVDGHDRSGSLAASEEKDQTFLKSPLTQKLSTDSENLSWGSLHKGNLRRGSRTGSDTKFSPALQRF